MVKASVVQAQLKKIGADFSFWGMAEARELPQILIEGEVIQHAINGRYEGGFAMLCATDHRVLLIDKKPLFLALDDLRYDMITEINYSYKLIDAMLHVCTLNKTFHFKSLRKGQLRALAAYIQQHILHLRQQQYGSAPADAAAVAALPTTLKDLPAIDTARNIMIPMATTPVIPDVSSPKSLIRVQGALGRRAINPYAQVSLFSRRRISPFDFARK